MLSHNRARQRSENLSNLAKEERELKQFSSVKKRIERMQVRIGIAAELQGVSPSTLRRWEKEEKIQSVERTVGGHRRYKLA